MRDPPLTSSGEPRQLHFLHIGKTGGTAIRHALRPFSDGPAARITLHQHHTTLAEIPPGDRVMFTLRDPAARFVSGFNSRLRQGRPRFDIPWRPEEAEAFRAFPTANDLANALSSRDIGQKTQAMAAMRSIRHVQRRYGYWLKDLGYLRTRWACIDWIGRTETLTRDFAVLKTMLCLPPDCELPSELVLAHKRDDTDHVHLDETGQRNIRAWYAADYLLLRHCCPFIGRDLQKA